MTTAPIPTGPTPTGAAGPNKLLIALIAIGGVLLLAVVAIIFLLIGQNSNGGGSTPATRPRFRPHPTPRRRRPPKVPATRATAATADSPSTTRVRFTSFDFDPTVECDPTGQAEEKAQPQISWASANAAHVYWTPNNNDANAENGYEVGASGNQNDMSASKGQGERYEFPCNHASTSTPRSPWSARTARP